MNKLAKLLPKKDADIFSELSKSIPEKLQTNFANGSIIGGRRRSSNNGNVVTVFGCSGFLGRYVVNALARVGTQVILPHRGDGDEIIHLKHLGDLGNIIPLKFDLRCESSIFECIKDSNTVINLIGRDYDSAAFSMRQINTEGAELIAKCTQNAEIGALLHVSSLSADAQSENEFAKSKGLGELHVAKSFPSATILRPGILVGEEDRVFNPIGKMAERWPVVPYLNVGSARKRPVYVCELASAIARIVLDGNARHAAKGVTFEFHGPKAYSHAELVRLAIEYTLQDDRQTICLPPKLYRLVAAFAVEWRRPIHRSNQISNWFLDEYAHTADASNADCVTADGRPLRSMRHLGIELSPIEQHLIQVLRPYRPEADYFNGTLNGTRKNYGRIE